MLAPAAQVDDLKALGLIEDHAQRPAPRPPWELDADEQRALALLDEYRRGPSGK